MKEKLANTTGKTWAFMDRFDIPDLTDPSKTYLTRWRLIQTPWFSIYLHRISLPDPDRYLHDHPWEFVSIILKGGYIEQLQIHFDTVGRTPSETLTYRRHWRRGSVHLMRTKSAHSIKTLDRTPTWTLVLTGRRKRVWGFWTPDGWVPFNKLVREDGTAIACPKCGSDKKGWYSTCLNPWHSPASDTLY